MSTDWRPRFSGIRVAGSSADLPVYKDPNCALFHDDGRLRLFTVCRATNPPRVLVHPDRWDAFCAALGEPPEAA